VLWDSESYNYNKFRKDKMEKSLNEMPVRNLRIAVIGAPEVGKTTLACNFQKGYIDEEKQEELNLKELAGPIDGKYEVDLDYNNFKYHITLEEQRFKDAHGGYLDSFNGVIYMFSAVDPESFVLLREFFVRRIAAEAELKPRVVVANKIDLMTEDDLMESCTSRANDLYTSTGVVNLNEAKKWVNQRMVCDFAEIIAENPANVDETFCLLVDIIEKAGAKVRTSIVSQTGSAIKRTFQQCFDFMTFCQIFLALLSLFGIIGLGAGFYSGCNMQGYVDDNWVYIVLLFLGIFSFIIGIVGFYGAKHKSKEYLKTVLFLLFPITFLYIIFMIFFFNDLQSIKNENLLSPTGANFIAVFNVVDIAVKIIAILLLMRAIKSLRILEVQSTSLSKTLEAQKNYKGLVQSFRPGPPRNLKSEKNGEHAPLKEKLNSIDS
jgi:GTPase SAR1 family protein